VNNQASGDEVGNTWLANNQASGSGLAFVR
jgi:hypothetical protein